MDGIYAANYCVNQNYESISFSGLVNAALYVKGVRAVTSDRILTKNTSASESMRFYNKVKLLS